MLEESADRLVRPRASLGCYPARARHRLRHRCAATVPVPLRRGGDAFDIAWAVDPITWQPAELAGFDFLRLTSALDVVLGVMGESSPEIDAVADVRPVACPGDIDRDNDVDLVDLIELRNRLGIEDPQDGFTIPGDLEMDAVLDVQDLVRQRAMYLGMTCD